MHLTNNNKIKSLEVENLTLKASLPVNSQVKLTAQAQKNPGLNPIQSSLPTSSSTQVPNPTLQGSQPSKKILTAANSPESPWIQVVKKKKSWNQIAKDNFKEATQKIASIQDSVEKKSSILTEMLRIPKQSLATSEQNSHKSNQDIPSLDSLTYMKVDLPLQMKFLSSLKVAAESTILVLSELTKCPIYQASALHAGRTEILIRKMDVPIFTEKIAEVKGAKVVIPANLNPSQLSVGKIPLNQKDIQRKAYLFLTEKNIILRQAILMDLETEDKESILRAATRLIPKLNFHPIIKNIVHKNIQNEIDLINLQKMDSHLDLDQVETDPLEDPNF